MNHWESTYTPGKKKKLVKRAELVILSVVERFVCLDITIVLTNRLAATWVIYCPTRFAHN